MDLRLLSVFKSVVDHRSFSRAAEACFLTQPAVSQAVRRLEKDAGALLLTRDRPPSPTPAGQRLYRHAADLLARDASARRDIEDIARGGGGVLTLGASQALSRLVLPRLVRAFHHRHPLAAFHLETHPSRELIPIVADGRLELGLGPFQKSMPGFSTRPLGTQRMILYAGRGTPAARALRKRGADALHEVPLVTSHLDAPGARPAAGRLRDRFRSVWEVHSLDLRLDIVRAGLAVGYLPEDAVAAARLSRALVPVDWLDFGIIRRQIGLFFLQRRPLSDAARAFLGVVEALPSPLAR